MVAIGFLTGVIIDLVMNKVIDNLKLEEEKQLDKLVKDEKQRIYAGEIKGQTPKQVLWV